MPRTPRKSVTFTIDQYPAAFRIKARLYFDGKLYATADRTVPMTVERGETADASELVQLLDTIVEHVGAYVRTDPLPFL